MREIVSWPCCTRRVATGGGQRIFIVTATAKGAQLSSWDHLSKWTSEDSHLSAGAAPANKPSSALTPMHLCSTWTKWDYSGQPIIRRRSRTGGLGVQASEGEQSSWQMIQWTVITMEGAGPTAKAAITTASLTTWTATVSWREMGKARVTPLRPLLLSRWKCSS